MSESSTGTASASQTDAPLFRAEVLEERQTRWLGTVLLEPRISHAIFASLAAVATIAVFALLFFTTYTRKERVNGWLVPQQGLVRIVAPQAGTVTQIRVREGQEIAKGAPLVVLSTELQTASLGAAREEIVRRLSTRRESMESEKGVQNQLSEQQRNELSQRVAALRTEQGYLAQELELQRARVQISEKALVRERELRARELIAEPRLQRAEQERLEQQSRVRSLERQQAALQRELLQVTGTLSELPLRRQTQQGEITRNVAALEQELAEAESRRQSVLTAPEGGVVTAIQTEPGGSVQANVPLLSIVPKGAVLQAHLFAPSRAVGFVRPGQRVLLRYQAFPYQKFGAYEGTITSVSRSALSPSELGQQLAGLSSLYGANEPVYRITVELAGQTATAYGEAVPLQPGMQLEADVLIETRRLIEWVLDPLYTVTGRWRS